MTSVFVLQHVHTTDVGAEDVKFVGVYSSRQNAHEAVSRLASMPGFSEAPDEFSIDEYRVDRDQWSEGFVTFSGRSQTIPPEVARSIRV